MKARTPPKTNASAAIAANASHQGESASSVLRAVEELVGDQVLDPLRRAAEGVGEPVDAVTGRARDPVADAVGRELRQADVGAREVDRDQGRHTAADDQALAHARVAAATAGDLLGPLARRRRRPVEHHRHHDDERTGHERRADVVDPQAGEHGLAEAGSVDERGQGGHRQRRQRGLVEADDDRLAGHRDLDLEQPLPVGLPGRVGGLDGRRRDLADAEAGDPDQRGQRVDEGGDHGRARADAEEEHDRQQVDEGRHRLHEVEEGRDDLVGPSVGADQHAQRETDEHGEHDGDAGDDEEVERVLPVAEDAEGEERGRDQQGDAPARDEEPDVRRDGDDAQPADLRHRAREVGQHDHPLQPLDRAAQGVGDRVGELHDGVGRAAGQQVVLVLREPVVQVGAGRARQGEGVGAVGEAARPGSRRPRSPPPGSSG